MSAGGGRRRHKGGGHDDHEEHMDERWLVSFADMMTLMFALFMVLFSISSVNTSKFEELQKSMQEAFSGAVISGGKSVMQTGASSDTAKASSEPPLPAIMPLDAMQQVGPTAQNKQQSAAAAAAENEDFKRLKARIDALAREAGLEGKVESEVRRRGLVVRLLTDDVFFSSGDATLKAGSLQLLTRIGHLIDEEARHPVVVEGYTDSQPIATPRYPSNWELSGARAAAVVRHFGITGINAQRMSLAGHAAQHPIDTNATVKKKLILVVPLVLLLVVGGGIYKFMFAAKAEEEHKPKVDGTVYVLGKEFLVNLADGRFAKLTVGLVLDPHDTSAAPAEAGGHGAAPAPPEGFGPMPQEAIVRDLITDSLTGAHDKDLIDPHHREELKKKVLKAIKKSTDVHAEEILFTDVTVQ